MDSVWETETSDLNDNNNLNDQNSYKINMIQIQAIY